MVEVWVLMGRGLGRLQHELVLLARDTHRVVMTRCDAAACSSTPVSGMCLCVLCLPANPLGMMVLCCVCCCEYPAILLQ
jgi:hypothetical protein